MSDPSEWRELWPEHAEAVYDALGQVRAALGRLATASGDPMTSAAAREWVIRALREEVESQLAAEVPPDGKRLREGGSDRPT